MKKPFKLGPIQKAWVRALRSGKYKQCTRVLTKVGSNGKSRSHCCLGVLCQLALKKGVKIKTHLQKESHIVVYGRTEYSTLPERIMKWAKVRDKIGSIRNNPIPLTGYNDSHKKSFKQIADIIEENAAKIFTRSA